MIGKITKGNGFAGVCSYILDKDEARLIGGNMASTTPRQLAAEFRVFSQKNQRVQLPVEHISLSPSPEDRELDESEWQALAIDLLDGLGMSRHQYIVVLHSDTEFDGKPRPHAHIIANRVSIDGQCADSWLDFHRAEEVIRHLEQKYELTPVASSWESVRAADTTGQIRRYKREASLGEKPQESIKRRLQNLFALEIYCLSSGNIMIPVAAIEMGTLTVSKNKGEQTPRRGRRLSILALWEPLKSFEYGLAIGSFTSKSYILLDGLGSRTCASIVWKIQVTLP